MPFYFVTLSPISILPERIAFLICLILLHSLHLYWTVILFVDFVFLFHDFIAGLECLPLFPVPTRWPLAFNLGVEPRDKGCAAERAFCFAVPTVCKVCFLQYGQYLFVSFGNFICTSDR